MKEEGVYKVLDIITAEQKLSNLAYEHGWDNIFFATDGTYIVLGSNHRQIVSTGWVSKSLACKFMQDGETALKSR